jgi:hypothetical protein
VKSSVIFCGDDWRPDPNHMHHGVYKAVNEFILKYNYELNASDKIYNGSSNKVVWNKKPVDWNRLHCVDISEVS